MIRPMPSTLCSPLPLPRYSATGQGEGLLPHPPTSPRRHKRRAFSLVEVLISLSISVTLLSAIAAAYSASASAIEMNDRFFRASQTARVTVLQLMNAVRCSQTVQLSGNSLHVVTQDGRDLTYTYNSSQKQLTVTNNLTGNTSPLARNLNGCGFGADYDEILTSQIVRVTVMLTVQIGNNQVLLSDSVAPRRVQTY